MAGGRSRVDESGRPCGIDRFAVWLEPSGCDDRRLGGEAGKRAAGAGAAWAAWSVDLRIPVPPQMHDRVSPTSKERRRYTPGMHDSPVPSINPQLAAVHRVLERHLGDTIMAVHLFGSALLGGLKPSSDVDLLVTVAVAPDEGVRNALLVDLLTVSAPPSVDAVLRPLELTVVAYDGVVPWRYPARRELQFGEWLRSDIVAGRFEAPVLDHDLAILLRQVQAHGVALFGPSPDALFEPVPDADISRALQDTVAQWQVPEDWAGDERNIVLALARIWYTTITGRIAAKDDAADWLLSLLDERYQHVLAAARAAYLGHAPDTLSGQPDAAADFIRYACHSITVLHTGRQGAVGL